MNINLTILDNMLKLEKLFVEKLKNRELVDKVIQNYLVENNNTIDARIKKIDSDIEEEIRKEGSFSKVKHFLVEKKLLEEYKKNSNINNIPYDLKLAFLRTRINAYIIGRIIAGTLEKRIKECESLEGYLKEKNLYFFSTAKELKELEDAINACIKDLQYWNPKNAKTWGSMFGYGDGIMQYTPKGSVATITNFIGWYVKLRYDITDRALNPIIQIIFSTLDNAIKAYANTNEIDYDYRKEVIETIIKNLEDYFVSSCIVDPRTVPIQMIINIAEFAKCENKLSEDNLETVRELIRDHLKEKLKNYANDSERGVLLEEALNVEKLIEFTQENNNISEINDENFYECDISETNLRRSDSQRTIYLSCSNLSNSDNFHNIIGNERDDNSLIVRNESHTLDRSNIDDNHIFETPTQKKSFFSRISYLIREYHPTTWSLKRRAAREVEKSNNHIADNQTINTNNMTPNIQVNNTLQPKPEITVIKISRFRKFCNSVSTRLHNIKTPKICSGFRSIFCRGGN